jgi:ribosomal protein S18 acetylase RimI-like enzyme
LTSGPKVEFRHARPDDEAILAEIFAEIDAEFFRPHPFTPAAAKEVANHAGQNTYALLTEDGRAVAYGILRGREEGYAVPSVGVAVRKSAQRRGLGRLIMGHLHAEAARHGATVVRLRVHPDNVRARGLYESMGYVYAGEDRSELVMLLDLDPTAGLVAKSPSTPMLNGMLLDVDAPEWEAALASAPHDFYHLPAYVAICAVQERARPGALYVAAEGREMVLPLLIRDIPGGGLDATSPYGYPGPIGVGTDHPMFLRVALAAGLNVLREAGIVSAFVRLHPLLNPVPPEGVGTLVHHGLTVSVDLTLPTEELWAQMRLNHRRDITRTAKLGYVARMDGDWTRLESFKDVYRATMARRSATQYYFFDDAYFDSLRDALGDRLRLFVVEKDGLVAAAGLFVETNGIVQYHLSGTSDRFRAVQPTKMMMHFVAIWAKARGNRVLHLGGGLAGDSDSLFQFKSRFSPLRHPFSTLRMVVDEQQYSRLVAARGLQLEPAARTGYFPLYRLE